MPAAGAVVITVLLVLESLQEHEVLSVFPVALVGIAGKTAEDCPAHKRIGHQRQNQVKQRQFYENIDNADCQTCTQDHHIQLVGTVTALHELPDSVSDFAEKAVHRITFRSLMLLLYDKQKIMQPGFLLFTDCLHR